MTPVPEGHRQKQAQPAGGAATPPAPPAQLQRGEPTVDATEEWGGPPLRRTYPAGDQPKRRYLAGGRTSQKNQRASTPDIAASGVDEARKAGQPGRGPDEPVPDAEHAASLPPPTAHGAQPAGRADTAPFATPAHHIDASASGKARPRSPPGARAKSGA